MAMVMAMLKAMRVLEHFDIADGRHTISDHLFELRDDLAHVFLAVHGYYDERKVGG